MANRPVIHRFVVVALLAQLPMTMVHLQDAVDDFDDRLAALDDTQETLELEISDSILLEEEIKEADQFPRGVSFARVEAVQKPIHLAKAVRGGINSAHHVDSGSSACSVTAIEKFTTIEFPKYSSEIGRREKSTLLVLLGSESYGCIWQHMAFLYSKPSYFITKNCHMLPYRTTFVLHLLLAHL